MPARTFRKIPDLFALLCPGTGLFLGLALCKALAMNNSIIVWDLETVRDLHGYAAPNDMSASTDEEVREALGDKFPKHICYSIVCTGTPHERALEAFLEGKEDTKPHLIGMAG